ncbi:hypothetical protein ACO0QE_002189 [Hanseniaspora vineae]
MASNLSFFQNTLHAAPIPTTIKDALPSHILFQLSNDLLEKVNSTLQSDILSLLDSSKELIFIISKSYSKDPKLRQLIRTSMIIDPNNLQLCNSVLMNPAMKSSSIFSTYTHTIFENETQLYHWILHDCTQHQDFFELTTLVLKMWKKFPESLENEIVFKKIILPNFLLKQKDEINTRDLRFLLKFFQKNPHITLNVSEISSFLTKANSIRKIDPQLNKKCLGFIFNLNHKENFNQSSAILDHYDSLLQDIAISNVAGVAMTWEALLKIEPDLLKHNTYIIYHLLKIFKKSILYQDYGFQIFEKLYPIQYFLKHQSLIGPFLQYAILKKDSDMAQNIITTISENVENYSKFNLSKYYTQLLVLHLSFNDSNGTSNMISKILKRQKNNLLPPYDLELIIRHILKTPHSKASESDATQKVKVLSVKIQEAIYLFNKTTKDLSDQEIIAYYTNCYPPIIKACVENLKLCRNSAYDIKNQTQYLKNMNNIDAMFANVKKWTPLNQKPPRAFQQSISSIYFDFLTHCTSQTKTYFGLNCLQLAKTNFTVSMNELENKTVYPQNPFNINQVPAITNKLIVNYANRIVILKNILRNAKKQKNLDVSKWCVSELKKYMGQDSYAFEQKLLRQKYHQRQSKNKKSLQENV